MEEWEIGIKNQELEFSKERIEKEFWIDAEGQIHRWKGDIEETSDLLSLHHAIAATINHSKYPEDVLYDMGWIAIGSAAYGNRIKGEPSQAQINTMFDLGYRRIRDSYGILYQF
jgi:hypothetical protein